LRTGRLLISLIGLAALALAYLTGSVVFLGLAVVAFIGGLYLMGANKKPVKKNDESATDKSSGK
jgi:Na+/proline symporter